MTQTTNTSPSRSKVAQKATVFAVPTGRISAWSDSFQQMGVDADFVDSAAALSAYLAGHWSVELVVLDLALASPDLLQSLGSGASAPELIALIGPDDAEMAGLAMSCRVLAYTDRDIRAEALGVMIASAGSERRGYRVADQTDRDFASLSGLSREAARIAAALAHLAQSERVHAPGAEEISASDIRRLIRARRARERFFPAELFSDPAWDMLLDLMAARLDAQPVAVSSLCIAAAVPTTTALRWIRSLCDAGIFERRIDPDDARRAFVTLSEASAAAMLAYLASIKATGVV